MNTLVSFMNIELEVGATLLTGSGEMYKVVEVLTVERFVTMLQNGGKLNVEEFLNMKEPMHFYILEKI